MPATIIFASFTGEEAGLLGSREFVRRAVADKVQDRRRAEQRHDRLGERLPARQHDPLLERGHPRHPARGRDAVHQSDHLRRALLQEHGRGCVLRSIRRHRRRHRLVPGARAIRITTSRTTCSKGINHQLVTEVAKTTAATVMLLASSPSRLKDLRRSTASRNGVALVWTPSPEKGVTGYIVDLGAGGRTRRATRCASPSRRRPCGRGARHGRPVKAVNAKGLEGWDWARLTVK